MRTNAAYASGVPRSVYYNDKDPGGNYLGVAIVDESATFTPGYSNQTHLHTGESVIIYHRSGPGTGYSWATTLSKDSGVGSGFFTKHWDVPDNIFGSTSTEQAMWPKAEVLYNDSTGRDYVHIVATEGNTAGGVPVMVAWERCYFGTNDSLICEAWRSGAKRYAIKNEVALGAIGYEISHFDSSCSITPVVAVSPVSKRVAIAFMKPAMPNGACDHFSDVCWVESMDNGNDWIAGTPWPPVDYNITNYEATGANERSYFDLNACYDFEDSLHIVYEAFAYDPATTSGDLQNAKLYHWCKKTGVSQVATVNYSGTDVDPGAHNTCIAKMSISAKDPIYHPGGDSVYLFCIWTQFDTGQNGADNYTAGEIYGCGTFDGGATWEGKKHNLTRTKQAGCTPGNCASEHWSSMAQNMYNGDLHIQYICDRDPGGAIQDDGSSWRSNPVMYLHLSEWQLDAVADIAIGLRVPSQASWYEPPLKVTPGGTRVLEFKVFNIGNANLIFTMTSDNTACIHSDLVETTVYPRDSVTVTATLDGSACNNSFIDGNVVISSNAGGISGKIDKVRIQAAVANDYYECPRDPLTHDSLNNGILAGYFNANSMERIHDYSCIASADTHDVFFQGGTIVATTRDFDTLVGRYMGDNDQHNGAQDKLYRKTENPSDNFWCLYTQRVFMHALNPPRNDDKWYWWELNKEIVFFKSTASSELKQTVIKFVTVERKGEPVWWPEHPTFTGYDNTYIGLAMDIDCPYDTFISEESARNRAGYDSTNNIAWQKGFGRADIPDPHPQYNNYYAGMALALGRQPGESTTPYSTHNVANNVYLYPTQPWGWIDQQLYELSADPTIGSVQYRYPNDSLVDRSQVFTARKINAGTAANTRASFTMIEAVAPSASKGLAELQANIAAARAWVAGRPLMLCGDVNSSGSCELGDVVYLISYLYKNGPAPAPPLMRADVNTSCLVELGDVVYIISYLYKNGPLPLCCGVW
jgi:hypothetical protein